MADATPLLPGFPDEISMWEILVRLPPKPLLRCRAVSPAWRRATSAPDFLLSHHARQLALPLLYSHGRLSDGGRSLDIVLFDHRAGVAAADRFQTVARLTNEKDNLFPEASCDGLLLLSMDDFLPVDNKLCICICNPATRQYAPLQQLDGFRALGLYPHPSTSTTGEGEYRLLLHLRRDEDQGAIYVFTLGSGQPPRHIEYPDPDELEDHPGLLFHGSIYWSKSDRIMVFDTIAESFRQICDPIARDYARLFDMGDKLGVYFVNDIAATVDIWAMEDCQGEFWDLKCRIKLPVDEIRQRCRRSCHEDEVMVVPGDGELLVLVTCNGWLFQVDVDGNLIATFESTGLNLTQHLLKETLVQHTFFPALEGYVVNTLSFI